MGKGLNLFLGGMGVYLTGAVLTMTSLCLPTSKEWKNGESLATEIQRTEIQQFQRNYRESLREADNLRLKVLKGEYESVCLNPEIQEIKQTRRYELGIGCGLMMLSTLPIGIGAITHGNDSYKKSKNQK